MSRRARAIPVWAGVPESALDELTRRVGAMVL
jgi:hypothetical protein